MTGVPVFVGKVNHIARRVTSWYPAWFQMQVVSSYRDGVSLLPTSDTFRILVEWPVVGRHYSDCFVMLKASRTLPCWWDTPRHHGCSGVGKRPIGESEVLAVHAMRTCGRGY